MTTDLPLIDSYVTLRCRVARVNPKAGVFLLDTNAEGPWYRPDHPDIVSIEQPASPLRWGEKVWLRGSASGTYVGLDPRGTGIVVTGCTCPGDHGNTSLDGWGFSVVARPDGTPIDWDATRAAVNGETA